MSAMSIMKGMSGGSEKEVSDMNTVLLFPSSFFDRRKVDEDLAQEYEAARAAGWNEIILFGYEDWFENSRLRLTEEPEQEVRAIYRGWMMKPDQYKAFYESLLLSRIRLLTTPDMYTLMHAFPNVYPKIQEDTAGIMTYPLHTQIDVREMLRVFPRFMVKDYVKSVKGTEFPVYFDDSVSKVAFDSWMEVFYKYRGDLLTGGICIKEYLDLKRYDNKTNEFRVFYVNHQVLSICRNSLQGNCTPVPPKDLVQKYRGLDSVFYTIDFAELADGTWKIIEAGDGGVSGLSEGQDQEAFYRALAVAAEILPAGD